MTIEELPDFRPPDFGEVRDPDRPVLSFEYATHGPHRTPAHSHSRAHIIHPESGALWVVTAEGNWLVPSGQAIWIPPHVRHEVSAQGPVSARLLFVDETHAAALPLGCGTVIVSPLLAQLLIRAIGYGNDYTPGGPAARLARVALDELANMEVAPLLIPISKERRLARVMQRLIDDPKESVTLDEVAKKAGASVRTLSRLFLRDTGMTFSQWRIRVLLVEAIARLSRGASVTEVATSLGYGTTSAFVYMFRSNMGVSPGRYRRRDARASSRGGSTVVPPG